MSINTRVRASAKTVVCDVEIQHQRDWSRRIREVSSQLDVPTLLTPTSSHLLFSLCVLCGTDPRFGQPPSRESSYHPSGWYKCRGGHQEHPVGTFCNHNPRTPIRNNRDLDTHGRGKECLSETSRPGLISTMRSDLPQPTHRLEKKDTFG